jgi:hypothetical protein
MKNVEKAILNPAATFKKPQEVLDSHELSREQKIEALRRWEYDLREVQVAEEEGMTPAEPETVTLDVVLKALNSLGVPSDMEHTAPTKQGGS